MRHALLVLLLAGCGGVTIETGPPPTHTGPTLTDVEWLLGDWVTDVDEHGCVISERWHRESEMLFAGRGKARCPEGSGEAHEPFHEDLRMEADERGLVYVATPSGGARTDFDLTSGGATGFVAENPDHDFPTRIEYRRTETGFDAIVSGPGRSFTLSMHPAAREAPDSP
jgi:hypothetical protein